MTVLKININSFIITNKKYYYITNPRQTVWNVVLDTDISTEEFLPTEINYLSNN